MRLLARSIIRAVVTLACATVLVAQSPAPAPAPAQAPPPPPARSLEQIAYDAAIAITDPARSATSLKALLENSQFKVHGIARQAQNSYFSLLVTKLPDRTPEINSTLDAMIAALNAPPTPAPVPGGGAAPAATPLTPMAKLNSITSYATQLVDAGILLDRAAAIVPPALEALKFDDYAATTKASAEAAKARNPNVTIPTEAQMRTTFESNRGRAFEVLGRIHLAQGNIDQAEREFNDAVKANSSLVASELGLAQIDVKRGKDKSALDHYLVVKLGGRMKAKDDEAMVALYKKVHGSMNGFDAALDALYRTKFPNPVKAEPYTPVANRSTRVVLAEMFTGSGCPPCVAADLAMDTLLEHYPAKDVIFLAYHANIPQPDPMVVAGGDTRRTYYKVPGVPTIHVDGTGRVGGGGRDNAATIYAEYIKMIDKQLAVAPAAEIGLTASRSASGVKVSVNVTKLAADVKDPRLHIVLGEHELAFSGENGVRFHNVVVRAVAGPTAQDGSGFALTPGAAKIDHTFDLKAIPPDLVKTLADEMVKRRKAEATANRTPGEYQAEGHAMTEIDPDALFVVAYVQDADKKVLQAAKIELTPARATRK